MLTITKIDKLNNGDIFKFAFELEGYWVYQKIDAFTIKCIKAPSTASSSVGLILNDEPSRKLPVVKIDTPQ